MSSLPVPAGRARGSRARAGLLALAPAFAFALGCHAPARRTPSSAGRGLPAVPVTSTTRGDDGRCAPEPRAGDACADGDSWCVLTWGEPGGASEALWCRDGRWVLETEANLPPED